MGSATTFETRQSELALLRHLDDVALVTEEDVLKSFVESVKPSSPDPFMLDYIKIAQVMLVVGDSLFVHGGLDAECVGKVPGRADTFLDVREWCEELNIWKNEMIGEYTKNPTWTGGDGEGIKRTRGGEALLDYGLPTNGTTVIYNTSFVQNGNCKAPDVETEEYCLEGGIRRVFVGHTPHGECPSVIKRTDLTVFMCDTSYSDMHSSKAGNPANNRGSAYASVLVAKNYTKVQGPLKDGRINSYVLCVDDSRNDLPVSLVGRQLLDDSWVKGVVDGNCYVGKGEGYRLDCKVVEVEGVLGKMKELPRKKMGGRELEEMGVTKTTVVGEKGGGAKYMAGFIARQEDSAKRTADKIKTKTAEEEAGIAKGAESFKAKGLVKGQMAKNAAKMKVEEEAKREQMEREAKAKAIEGSLLSAAPSRMVMHEKGGRTMAQERAAERKEEELRRRGREAVRLD